MKVQQLNPRFLRLFFAVLAIAIVLSACGGAAPTAAPPTSAPAPTTAPPPTSAPAPTSAPPTAAPTVAPTAAPQVVTLTFWWLGTSPGQIAAVKQALDLYTKAHPTIKVEPSFYNYDDYSKAMPAALAAGNPPDFSFADPTAPNMPNYVAAGQILPIADLLKARGWEDKVQKGTITFYDPLYGDKSYGVPLIMALRGLIYNKKILQDVGGDVPKTLDEFDSLLAKVKAKGYTPLGMGNSEKWGSDYYWQSLMMLYLADGDWQGFVRGTMKQQPGVPWGGDAVRKGMAKFLEWKDKGYFNPDFASLGSDDIHKLFAQGKVFAYANGASQNASLIQDKPDFEIGFFNWPRVYPDKPLLTLSDPGNLLVIPKDSKHPKEAADVIDWLLSPDVGKIFAENGQIPLHKVDLGSVTLPVPLIKDELAAVSDQTQLGWLSYMAPPDFPDKEGSELQKLLARQSTLDKYMAFLQKLYDDTIKNK